MNGAARTRARWLGLGAVVVAVATAIAVVAVLRHDGATDRRAVPSVEQADALARQACTLTRTLIAEVGADAPADTVLALADQAAAAADDAAYGSPRWVQLNGAVQALARALRVNDARLAAVGMQQIDGACAATGVTVR